MSPTFWLEAMTAARRGRLYWIRFLYGSLLFIVLVTCLPRAGGLDTDLTVQRDHGARFGSTFFNAFAWVQTAGVLLICPAIFAGAVAGNRERGVLDHTLVTDLSSREIVFGKLAARLLEVFNFLLVAVPILALAMLLGGIRDDVLMVFFVMTVALVLSTAGVSLFFSTISPRSRDAVTRTYALGVLLFGTGPALLALIAAFSGYGPGLAYCVKIVETLHPISQLRSALETTFQGTAPNWTQVIGFAAFHTSIFAVSVAASILWLRRLEFAPKQAKSSRRGRGSLDWLRPLVEQNAVLWKDLAQEHSARWGGRIGQIANWLFGLMVAGCAIYNFTRLPQLGLSSDEFYHYVAFANSALGCAAGLAVAIRAACSVTSEIEKDTWTVLASTPLSASEILWSKLLACLYGARSLFVLILLHDVLAVLRWPPAILGIGLSTFALLLIVTALGCIGLRVSVGAKSSVVAISYAVAICVVCSGAYLFCGFCCLFGVGSGEAVSLFFAPCIPFLLAAPFYWFEPHVSAFIGTAALLGLLGYAVTAFATFGNAGEVLEARFRIADRRGIRLGYSD